MCRSHIRPILNNHANAAGLQQHKLHLCNRHLLKGDSNPFFQQFQRRVPNVVVSRTPPPLLNVSRKCRPFANLRPCSSETAGLETSMCTSHKRCDACMTKSSSVRPTALSGTKIGKGRFGLIVVRIRRVSRLRAASQPSGRRFQSQQTVARARRAARLAAAGRAPS